MSFQMMSFHKRRAKRHEGVVIILNNVSEFHKFRSILFNLEHTMLGVAYRWTDGQTKVTFNDPGIVMSGA